MNAFVQEWVVDNDAWIDAAPRLSILIPFLNDNPCGLIATLDHEFEALGGAVEIVLLDDGSSDDELATEVIFSAKLLHLPTRLVRLSTNEGRAKGRNRLTRHARGRHFLFLDSDMLPDATDFLRHYVTLIDAQDPAVTFGGFSLDQTPRLRELALHRRLAERSDCAVARVRTRHPEKFVFTSNLLVRRDVFDSALFDVGFEGWGWEDVEWGIRISRQYSITHIDNPASHLGLDPARTVAVKYEQSAANFARVLAAHPEVVRAYPTFRVANALKFIPFSGVWRPLIKTIALIEVAPVGLRAFFMRLYRAAVCSAVI